MKKLKKDINRPNLYDYLKIIALITMLVDHLGYFLFPEYGFLRVVGRISFPIFLFLVGFSGSYSWRWDIPTIGFLLRGFSFSLFEKYGFGSGDANILIGITIARFFLNIINKKGRRRAIIISFFFILIHPVYNKYVDYGSLSFFFTLRGRIVRYHKKYFFLGIIPLIRCIVNSIIVFDFGFKQGDYKYLGIICLLFFVFFILALVLSKENINLQTGKKRRDSIVLGFSKHALAFYRIHIVILSSLGLLRFGFI